MAKKKTLRPNGVIGEKINQNETGASRMTVMIEGSEAELADRQRLYNQIVTMDMSLVDFIASTDNALSVYGQGTQGIDRMQIMRDSMLINMVVGTLRRGVRPSTILAAAGTYVGYCAMGGNLKGAAGNILGREYDPFVSQLRSINEVSWRSAGASQFEGVMGRMAFETAAKTGNLPLSPEAAAVMAVGLDKRAFQEMREPGADVAKVREHHALAKANLYAYAEQNGISAAALDANVSRLIVRMQGTDLVSMYVGYSGVHKAEPVMGDDGIPTGAWRNGQGVEFSEQLVREPYTSKPLMNDLELDSLAYAASSGKKLTGKQMGVLHDLSSNFGTDIMSCLENCDSMDVHARVDESEDLAAFYDFLRVNLEAVRDGRPLVTGGHEGVDEAFRIYSVAIHQDHMPVSEAGRVLMNTMGVHAQNFMVAYPEKFAAWQQSPSGRSWVNFLNTVKGEPVAGPHESAAEAAVGEDRVAPDMEYERSWTAHGVVVDDESPLHPENKETNATQARVQVSQQTARTQGSARARRRVSYSTLVKEDAAAELIGSQKQKDASDGVITSSERRSEIVLSNKLQQAIDNPAAGLDAFEF